MAIKLAINGFGRIGRATFKIALEHPEIDIVAINDLGDVANLAYLLRYDSIYGRYAHEVKVEGTTLNVRGQKVAVVNEKDPTQLPWSQMGVDVVIESTGIFTEKEKAQMHITAGAKHVIISAPTKSQELPTVILGVNQEAGVGQQIISNASCTTNCVTPVMAVLESTFGVEKAMMTTAHAYTATQSLVDSPEGKDVRRGRAAPLNIVPSTTGAAESVIKALPALQNKFDGLALRVPVPIVSLSDFTALLKKDVTIDEVNQAFRDAAAHPSYRGVITTTDEQVVSSDFIGDPHSAIVDLALTRLVGGNLVKIMAWYDNEWGYSNRLVEQVIEVMKPVN